MGGGRGAGRDPTARLGPPRVLASRSGVILQLRLGIPEFLRAVHAVESSMGVKKTGKGRRKLGQKKRRMRARIRHRKG